MGTTSTMIGGMFHCGKLSWNPIKIIEVERNEGEVQNWRIIEDSVIVLENKFTILLREGFELDFGSVPRFAWTVDNPLGDGKVAYMCHDWLYASEAASRQVCDDIMLEILCELDFGWARRNTIYKAVRLGGGVPWRMHKPHEVMMWKNYGKLELAGAK